jgi:hypothetical protein
MKFFKFFGEFLKVFGDFFMIKNSEKFLYKSLKQISLQKINKNLSTKNLKKFSLQN